MKAALRDIARAWIPRAAILALTGSLLLLIPSAFTLPVPDAAIELDEARVLLPGMEARMVSLPHRWPGTIAPGSARAAYVFTLPDLAPDEPHVLLIPTARLALTAQVDGRPLLRDTPPPAEVIAGFAGLMRLPPSSGGGSLEIVLTRDWGMVPGYLSPVYVAAESDLARDRWLWAMREGVMSAVAAAVHALIVFAVVIVWTARKRDPVFGWLLFLGAVSLLNIVANSFLAPAWLGWLLPYGIMISAGAGLGVVGLAMAIAGVRRPPWLRAAAVGAPVTLICLTAWNFLPVPVSAVISTFFVIGGNLAGGVLLLGGGTRAANWDRLFLAAPFLLMGCFALRDLGVVLGLLEGGVLVTYHIRTLIIVAVLALLMRRLARTLNALDAANETQRRILWQQEIELSRLHREEQKLISQAAREEERQRLMRDLHDGVSGHLVSIIALAERKETDRTAIGKTARAALEDLRLVINSLDVEDGDLRFALGGFHERLAPQLRRLGVTLRWSMERLPEIGGVTPGNALSILRILQEAVTNALKHGPARNIEIRGEKGDDGGAILTVRNDASGVSASGAGRGLDNMRRRAQRLGGDVLLRRDADHSVLTLTLPAHMAEG